MKPALAMVALLGAFALSCSGAPPGPPIEPGPETCDNGKDDNGDKKVDCADPKCFSSTKCKVAVERCDNGVDDDNNGNTDCLDSACQGIDCGAGCVCTNMARSESNCSDMRDNDADNLTDCQDFDCRLTPPCGGTAGGSGTAGSGTGGSSVAGGGTGGTAGGTGGTAGGGTFGTAGGGSAGTAGGGTGGTAGGGMMTGPENCSDGIDNDADRAVDCVDSNCAGTSACVSLPDGAACAASNQCAGGLCFTEQASGFPNGYCANLSACTGFNTGCNGGICLEGKCRVACTGNGMGVGPRCRAGYACSDHDFESATQNLCWPLCNSDAECVGTGAGYGCNAMSKRCEQKVSPGGGYGAPCNSHSDCQSKYCLLQNLAGGYCAGDCRADTNNCGPGGYCQWNAVEADIVGLCHQSCSAAGSLCRTNPVDYLCKPDLYGAQMGLLCMCNFPGTPCSNDTDCCSNFCSVATNRCM